LSHIPLPRRAVRCEIEMGRQMGMTRMSLGQQALFTLGAAILTYGSMVVLATLMLRSHRAEMLQAVAAHAPARLLGILVGALLLLFIQGAAFAIVGAAARQKAGPPAKYGLWLLAYILLWQTTSLALVAHVTPPPLELLAGALIAILLAAALAILGRLTLRVGHEYRQWLELDI